MTRPSKKIIVISISIFLLVAFFWVTEIGYADTTTLRPDSAGAQTTWIPSAGSNYAAVGESVTNDSTYVENTDTAGGTWDFYNITTDANLGTATAISSVEVFARVEYIQSSGSGSVPSNPTLNLGVRSGTSVNQQGSFSLSSAYASYSYSWATNPFTASAWTKTDIDNLQVGILSGRTTGSKTITKTPRVSQVWVVVTYTAPDVTAPTPNPMTFSVAPNDASATSISMTATTATDSSTPINYYFSFHACAANGGTGGNDSGYQVSTSYVDSGLQANRCYGYRVAAKDNVGNVTASSTANEAYTAANIPGAPTISGVTETTATLTNAENGNPASNPTTYFAVQVVNTTDANWNNKYINASGAASASAVWLSDSQLDNLIITGLTSAKSYDVKVKARNESLEETAFSSVTSFSTVDVNAPTPNPMTFATPPNPMVGGTSVNMNASTATDDSGGTVNYYFSYHQCASNNGIGGSDSVYQTSTNYQDTGLQYNRCYGYRVAAKDPSGNVTASSSLATVYTYAQTPTTPSFLALSDTTASIALGADSNPSTSPETYYAARINSIDGNWSGKYVNASGDPSATAVWIAKSTFPIMINGLQEVTSYDVEIKARNESGSETSFSPYGNTETFAGAPFALSFANVTATTLRLQWDGNANEYRVESCTGSGCSAGFITRGNSNTLYLDDSGLTGNTLYRYRVYSVWTDGESDPSALSNVLTLPDAPTVLSFDNILTTSQIVNWVAPTGGADTYKIERCTGSGCSSFVEIQAGVAGTSFNDTGLTQNTLYRYRVRATNATGDGNYSAIAESTTLTPAMGTSQWLRLQGARLRGIILK